MATGKNAICKKFYSKIPQVGWYLWCEFFVPGIVSYSVLLLLPTCEAYWQGGWTFAGKAMCELFAYSACMGEHSFLGGIATK